MCIMGWGRRLGLIRSVKFWWQIKYYGGQMAAQLGADVVNHTD